MTPHLRRTETSPDAIAQTTAAKMSRQATSPIDEGRIMRPNMGSMDDIINQEYLQFERKGVKRDLDDNEFMM